MGGEGDGGGRAHEGHAPEEDREHLRQGDEGGGAHEGHAPEEGGEHPRQGDEGGRAQGDEGGGAHEGHAPEEGGEHSRQGDEGGGAHEGHEVSWTPGPPLCAPVCASVRQLLCVWVSPHSGRARAACVTSMYA